MESPRKLLKKYRIRPVKNLGQSFLVDNNITSRIVEASKVDAEDTVVEIGAGLGAMTAMIAARAKRVIAVEIDPKLVKVLESELCQARNIEIIEGDVLSYDFSSPLAGSGKVQVVGNIPYNVSSQIIFRLLEFRNHISSATLMLQREVAERITAPPGTKAYGILSVILPMYARVRHVMTVPATCFYPMPKVDSSVLRLEMLECPRYPLGDNGVFLETVKAAFAMRRKTLANNLKGMPRLRGKEVNPLALLREAGIDGGRRGETLSVEEFATLSESISRTTESL